MKFFGISAVLAGIFVAPIVGADAAYPVYPSRQVSMPTNAVGTYGQMPQVVTPQTVPQVMTGTVGAASPTRITGALPRVGSTASTAGRQYYQPTDYERLADSGLYVGLSVGYSASVMGGMDADYSGEQDAYFVPGAFRDGDFSSDSVIPLQISVGAALNNDFRADFSYMRYSGLSYPGTVQTYTGESYVAAAVDGGAITSNATMLNVYYNIDAYTGYLAGGSLRPYVGVGAGLALNTIADYVVYDSTLYEEIPESMLGSVPAGTLTAVKDIYAYHNGGTMEQFAFMLEGGISTSLEGGVKMDFFVRYANLGQVKTSGSIILSQTELLADGYGGEYEAPYDSVFHYTNWTESGRLSMVDVGVRLRLQF